MNILRSFRTSFLGLILSVVAGAACSGSSDTPLLNTDCTINSDCNDPLACVFKKCHTKCTSSRDCNANERCVQAKDVDTGKVLGNVCQLPEETHCHVNSDCPDNLICGVDGQCRNQCDQNRDCVGAQICTAHTCAEQVELNDAGMLMQVIDGGTTRDGIPLGSDADTLPAQEGGTGQGGSAGTGGSGGSGGIGGNAGSVVTAGSGGNGGDVVTAGNGGSGGVAGASTDGGPTNDVSQGNDGSQTTDAAPDTSLGCTSQAAGTRCGTNMVCNGGGSCVTCVSDVACPNGSSCKAWKTSCATGVSVCKVTTDNAADFTACGGNNYCSAGQCLFCSAGTACIPANECHKGQIVCNGDAGPVCNDTAQNATDDTPCQLNKVCSTGVCVAANRTLAVTLGQSQSALIDALLTAPVQLTLTDNTGTPVPGKTVTLVGPPGAGARPATAVTDGQGSVSFTPRVGLAAGSYDFTATAEGAAALKFTATATLPAAGTVFTVVNTDHATQSDGFPGPATLAHISGPTGFAAAADGSIYVADYGNARVFKLSPQGALSLVAGNGSAGSTGDGNPAISAQIGRPFGLALDEATSSLYISDFANSTIRRVDLATGLISTFVGGGTAPSPGFGDSGFRTGAVLLYPSDISLGPDGALYISDAGHNRIRRVAPNGIIDAWLNVGDCTDTAALAGCYTGGEGCAVTWDKSGAAFVSGQICGTSPGGTVYGVIRKPVTGPLTHVTGHAASGASSAESVPAIMAPYLAAPRLAFDDAGNLFVSAYGDHKIRRIDGVDTRIKTIAGDGTGAYLGDYAAAAGTQFNNPSGMLMLAGGNLMIADYGNHAVRAIWGIGTSTPSTAALSVSSGNGQSVRVDELAASLTVKLVDGSQPPKALGQALVQWQAVDPGGALYASTSTTNLSGLASVSVRPGLAVGAYRFQARVTDLHGVDITGSPAAFTVNGTAPNAGDIFTVVDTDHSPVDDGLNGAGVLAHIRSPQGVAAASDGTIYIADRASHRVTMLTPKGVLVPIAGNGSAGYSGEGGAGPSAQLNAPSNLALDEANGFLYVADTSNNRIRVIDLASGSISLYAGGTAAAGPGYGDSGPATSAALSNPGALTFSPLDGALYIADNGHNEIRKVAANGQISTFFVAAGGCTDPIALYNCNTYGCSIACDATGNVYISGWMCGTTFASSSTGGIVKKTAAPGVTWIAGHPVAGASTADGSDATLFNIGDYTGNYPLSIGGGDLYVTRSSVNKIGRINLATGKFTSFAGDGTSAFLGDYVPALTAEFKNVQGTAWVTGGHLVIADYGNSAVRMIW